MICKDPLDSAKEEVTSLTPKGLIALKKASAERHDGLIEDNFNPGELVLHKRCREKYVHPFYIKREKHSAADDEACSPTAKRLRQSSSADNFNFSRIVACAVIN